MSVNSNYKSKITDLLKTYQNIVIGGVTSMDDFLLKFFPKVYRRKHAHLLETDYCKYDDQILTLFTSSLYYAALVSTFGASVVTRNKGRRASILVGGASFFVGGVINAFAQNVAMLIVGRIFLGFGIGFGNQVSPNFHYFVFSPYFHIRTMQAIGNQYQSNTNN